MNNLLEAISSFKWRWYISENESGQDQLEADINSHNDALDRIAEVAQQPRVMKLWTEDCKPINNGYYWIRDNGGIRTCFLSKGQLCRPYKDLDYTHWLELEPTPILP
jgi:hypothetical protein